jgi:CheY-like chemotaxis protein
MNPSRARLLIIEDSPEMAEMLAAGLQHDRLEIQTVDNGTEALAWVRQQKFDLVLLDLGLPKIDGTEVLRRIKGDHASAHLPVIVMTGRQGTADKLQAFELGAADYVTKPFVLVELRARVESVLRAKRLQDELSEANRQLSVKAEFLAQTSHEIRTQLGAVTSLASLLGETDLTAQQRDYISTIRTSGESVLTLLNDILHVSKIEAGKLELEKQPFHLRLCMDEVLDLLATKATEKNLDLLCEMEPGTPEEVIGDAHRLRQILINLVSNAVKFTDAGEVALSIRAMPRGQATTDAAEDPVQGLEPPFQEFHFSVRDTGIGIPASRLSRLFQSFSQTDSSISRNYGGSGLGLFICKGLVELMGGRLWAESTEGLGSTFHFTVPLPTAPGSEPAAWQGPQPHLNGHRLLIVDDNANCAKLLARKTQRWGMAATIAANATEAVECLRQDRNFDLAVIDLCLPDGDGVALGRRLRQLVAPVKMPLVLLVPMGRQAAISELTEGGVVVVVNKPGKPALLHSAFLRALAAEPSPKPEPEKTSLAPQLDSTLGARVPLRILLTDDNLINQKVGAHLLQRFGYQPTIAGSGAEALAVLQRQRYDVIFMDVQMPGMDGLETTRRIRALEGQTGGPASFIVAMTANAMPGDRQKYLAAGMDEYLAKPVSPERLQAFFEERGRARLGLPAPAPAGPPEPAPAPAPAPPGIDFRRLLDFAGGSRENLVEIIDLYLQQTSDQLAQMKDCAARQDRAALGRLAHTCAGASGICGLNAMSAAARQLQHACSNGHSVPLLPLVGTIDAEFEQTRGFLLRQRSSPNPA